MLPDLNLLILNLLIAKHAKTPIFTRSRAGSPRLCHTETGCARHLATARGGISAAMMSSSRSLPTAATVVFHPVTRNLARLCGAVRPHAFDELGLQARRPGFCFGAGQLRGVGSQPSLDAFCAESLQFRWTPAGERGICATGRGRGAAPVVGWATRRCLQKLNQGYSRAGVLPACRLPLPSPDYRSWPGLSRDTPFADHLHFRHHGGAQRYRAYPWECAGFARPPGKGNWQIPALRAVGASAADSAYAFRLVHVFGQFYGALGFRRCLVAEVHFEDRLQAPRLARLVKQERISVLAAVPRVLDLHAGLGRRWSFPA